VRRKRSIPRLRRVPKSRRIDVTRAEFDRVIDLLNERGRMVNEMAEQLDRNTRSIQVQFARFAQIQAELDRIKRSFDGD